MDAGKFRKRVSIERPTTEVGEYGHREEGWTVVAECFAEVRPVGSRERLAAAQMQSGQTHVVTVRYQPALTDASGEWRIVLGTRLFNLVGYPRNLSERDDYLIFDCFEGGTDGH